MTASNLGRRRLRVSASICRAITLAAGLLLAAGGQAHAVSSGSQFLFTADQTMPSAVPAIATALVTLGAPDSLNPGFFTVTGFDLSIQTLTGGDCLIPCRLPNPTLTGLEFDSATLGLNGVVTGSFPGKNGGTHYWEPYPLTPVPPLFVDKNGGLFFTDIVPGSTSTGQWNVTDLHVGSGGGTDIRTASGTYNPLTAVAEPSSVILLGLGLAVMARRATRAGPGRRRPLEYR